MGILVYDSYLWLNSSENSSTEDLRDMAYVFILVMGTFCVVTGFLGIMTAKTPRWYIIAPYTFFVSCLIIFFLTVGIMFTLINAHAPD